MRGNTPGTRAATPVPRKPRPLLLQPSSTSPSCKKIISPTRQGRFSTTRRITSPVKSIVFQRNQTPMIENTNLSEDTLRKLRQTRSLFLCCRNILSFSHIRYLEYMTQLSSLNVHMNSISRIECLNHLQNLTELDISANELRTIDDDAFKGLRQLKRLNLSSNLLTNINGFQNLPSLEWISLSFNELEDIRGFRRLPRPQKLLHLDICGNKITTLSHLEESLENCREIQDLRVETPRGVMLLPSSPPPQLCLRENPFCLNEPNYVDILLKRYQKLIVLNGVPCGCDPTEKVRSHENLISNSITSNNNNNNNNSNENNNDNRQLVWDILDRTSPTVISPHISPLREERKINRSEYDNPAINMSTMTETATYTTSSTTGASNSNNSSSISNCNDSRISSLPWRSKRVSRGVVTKVSIPPYKELNLHNLEEQVIKKEFQAKDEYIEKLELKLKRAQEQLSLRVVLEEDLRRHLEDVRQSHETLIESAASEKKILSRQVLALKDELSRRSEETAILQRKNRVELEEQTKLVRIELQKQKKESIVNVRRMEDEMVRTRKEANEKVLEINAKLEEALQHKEWLEQQNSKILVQIKKTQNELQISRSTEIEYENKLNFYEEIYQLQINELLSRRQLEFITWREFSNTNVSHFLVLQREIESLHLNQQNHQRAWEEYTTSLQKHYQEAILQVKLMQKEKEKKQQKIDIGCDPINTDFILMDKEEKEKEKEDLQRLQTALSLAKQSQELLSHENERLLTSLENKERELKEITQLLQESEVASRVAKEGIERERENFLRTIHNLREAVEKKDAALDEIEKEAKMKIDEKRSAIAKLEARLEDAEDVIANHRHDSLKLQQLQEEVQHLKLQLHERPKYDIPNQQQQNKQLSDLMEVLNDTKQKLAAAMVREHQQQLKLARAAEALTLLRGQLVKVDEVNTRLMTEINKKEASLKTAEEEKRRLTAQWREAQETTRARQRATLQALSQMIVVEDNNIPPPLPPPP